MKTKLFILLLITTSLKSMATERDFFWPIKIEIAHLNSMQRELTVHPVGWSRDGKTALIIEHYRADIAAISYTYLIVDLLTDKELYRKETPFRDMRVFTKELKELGIIQSRGMFLDRFPYLSGNNEYNVTLESSISQTDVIYRLFFESTKLGRKEIAGGELSYDEKVENMEIAGFFKSPYEERIAVIVLTVPNHSLLIVGSHLKYRFRE